MYRFDWGTVSPLTESTTNTIKKTKQNKKTHKAIMVRPSCQRGWDFTSLF